MERISGFVNPWRPLWLMVCHTSASVAEIDRLVYQLCGLTDEEIAIVEGSGK